MPGDQAARKRRGAWYTPADLIDIVVTGVLDDLGDDLGDATCDRPIRVLDPACGDARFLVAIEGALRARHPNPVVELTGCDVDADALLAARAACPTAHLIHADALAHPWDGMYDIVIGNPPFLSQMATATTRGGASEHGGGPYADAAVEFLALALRLADPDRGRIGLVLPQSILGARDAAAVRERARQVADLTWSWWEPRQAHFDAAVNVCALGFARPGTGSTAPTAFTEVVTSRLGIPGVRWEHLDTAGTLADRAALNANFRDEYYALVPAVGDHVDGPPLVTSGLIDPGVCHWGERPVTFAKRRFAAPRVDLARLDGRFPAWARRKLVPKVLVANQTRIVEAVADPDGAWLPGVPVTTVTPHAATDVWAVTAVLTSPVASVAAWQHGAGTGLSTRSVRVGPAVLAAVPWPAGSLDAAVAALRDGDVVGCAHHVCTAYGLTGDAAGELITWWSALLPDGIAGRAVPATDR